MRNLSRLMLLFYLPLACLPSVAWSELAKLPELVRHYAEHLEESPDTSLATFWAQHYGEQSKEHQSQEDHSKLPFKGDVSVAFGVAAPLRTVAMLSDLAPTYTAFAEKILLPKADEHADTRALGCVWQPPRV